MKQNYQLVLEKTLKALQAEDKRPSLLLHSCCGPCSSYVMEYLAQYFDITIFYYNPNISPAAEFQFRAEEQQRLIHEMGLGRKISAGHLRPERFLRSGKGIMKRNRRAANAASNAIVCVWRKRQELLRQAAFLTLPPPISISPHKTHRS